MSFSPDSNSTTVCENCYISPPFQNRGGPTWSTLVHGGPPRFRLHQALQETKFQGRHGLSGRDLQALALRWEIPGSQRKKVVAKFNQRSSLKMQNFKGELRRPCERKMIGNDPLFEIKHLFIGRRDWLNSHEQKVRLSFDIFVGCWMKNPGVSLKRIVLLFLQCHLVLQLLMMMMMMMDWEKVWRQQYAMILSTYEIEARKVHNVAVSGVAQQLQDSRTGQISSRP